MFKFVDQRIRIEESFLSQEKPILESQRSDLLGSIADDVKSLRDLEDRSLSLLQNTEGRVKEAAKSLLYLFDCIQFPPIIFSQLSPHSNWVNLRLGEFSSIFFIIILKQNIIIVYEQLNS